MLSSTVDSSFTTTSPSSHGVCVCVCVFTDPSEQGNAEQKSKLGEDLLRMFLNEINTDVTIQVGHLALRESPLSI